MSDYKYTIDTCPKTEDFFVRGGRCGWAHVCKDCEQMIKPRLPKWAIKKRIRK